MLEILEDLRVRSANTGDEYAAMVSARTGNRVGRILHGEPGIVRGLKEAHFDRAVPGHPYVQVHTHPAGSSFSLQDGITLGGNGILHAMVVSTPSGRWYLLSKARPEAWAHAPIDVLRERFSEALARLDPPLRQLVDAGEITDLERVRRLTHTLWTEIAENVGLRYDRR